MNKDLPQPSLLEEEEEASSQSTPSPPQEKPPQDYNRWCLILLFLLGGSTFAALLGGVVLDRRYGKEEGTCRISKWVVRWVTMDVTYQLLWIICGWYLLPDKAWSSLSSNGENREDGGAGGWSTAPFISPRVIQVSLVALSALLSLPTLLWWVTFAPSKAWSSSSGSRSHWCWYGATVGITTLRSVALWGYTVYVVKYNKRDRFTENETLP